MEIETKGKPAVETEQAPIMDTSKMSAEQRDALELTEAARDAAQAEQGFAGGLFMGRFNLPGIFPYPQQSAEDRDKGDLFLQKLEIFLRDHVDPDEIDVTGEIPQAVIDGLAGMGAFGIKISRDYGGLGLSQTNYCRAGMMLGSYCGNLTALISAHQSIGVPQPLIMFGNEQQKRRYLPRVARGEISAFALTEPKVGSDPAKMETHAEPTEDGTHFVINGEKLWCTNGVKAGVIVVMAKTPPKMVRGKPRNQITAFIVDMHDPGVEVATRCRFMGLKALYNAVIRFKDVKVPRENILLEEGKGLRVALTTLNTGRLTLPAACAGFSKRCLEITAKWANERVQWGQAIGKHAAIADKIARIAANTFAMEAMSFFAAALVDKDKSTDIRLEAAMCKLWATERAWEIVDDTMQIRGGRGYETAASLKGRGEEPIAVERMMRDSRINLIFEGSSEIMRLFIAREALDPHLKIGAPMLNSQLPLMERAKTAARATAFYARWYPQQWYSKHWFRWKKKQDAESEPQWEPTLRRHVRFAEGASRKLARTLFHAMALNGPKLESKQILLGRFVDIGTELFAITASCSRAQAMLAAGKDKEELIQLVDYFCKLARLRVRELFDAIHHNADKQGYSVARKVLDGKYGWLGEGIVKLKGKMFTGEK
jgi:alkylation response protein AidB-like acyl-CoA dehydrogenase